MAEMEIPTRNSKSNFSFMIFCLLLLDLCHPIALVDTAVLLSTYYYLLPLPIAADSIADGSMTRWR